MMKPTLYVVMIVFAIGLWGWICWYREVHKHNVVQKQHIDERTRYNKDKAEMEGELERLRHMLRMEENTREQMADELDALGQVIGELAEGTLSDDVRRHIGRIGWGVYDDTNEDYAEKMKRAYAHSQSIIEAGRAVCSTDGRMLPPEIVACVLDAFDGYVRYYLVKPVPYAKRVRMIKLAFFLVNQRAKDTLNLIISREYLESQLSLIEIKEALEEQKRRKRDADREFSLCEIKDMEKQRALEREMEKLRRQMEKAFGTERQNLVNRIAELKKQVEKLTPAISNAQLTRRGTVYVISNVGSFGENVYKIGMTRRTDPQERIDELGVASVPFPFDVHAFISTEDAPRLEYELHELFKENKVNKEVLHGREFFRVDLDTIKKKVSELGYRNIRWEEDAVTSDFTQRQDSRKTEIETVLVERVENTSIDTYDSLISYLNKNNIQWTDKRDVGGCLWVADTPEIGEILSKTQFDGKRFMKAQKTKHFKGNAGWFLTR